MTSLAALRIARNTAWFTVGSVLQKLISFVYFTVIAMTYGVGGTGKYFFALTFTALFAVVADWGLSGVLTREVAKNRDTGVRMLPAAFLIKGTFALATALLITLTTWMIGYDALTRAMVGIATAVLVLDSLHLGLFAVLRGLQRVHYEAMGLVIGQSVLTMSGIVILIVVAGLQRSSGVEGIPPFIITRSMSPLWLLIPYLATSVTNIVVACVGWIREGVFDQAARWIRAGAGGYTRWLLTAATPFAIAGVLARVYTYSDTFLLSILAGETAVGYYSTPFKIAFAFQFIPLAFMGALYPAMSAAAKQSTSELRVLYEQGMRALAIVVLPIAVGIIALADTIIRTFYGAAFAPSIAPLVVLMASLPFIFMNFPAGNLLNAADRQSVNTKLIAIAAAVNILANVILIPPFGAFGAALSACIGSITLAVVNALAVHRIIHYRVGRIVSTYARALLASGVMAGAVSLASSWTLTARIALGAMAYIVSVVALRAIRHDDFEILRAFRRTRSADAAV